VASIVKRVRGDGTPSFYVKYRAGDGRVRWERFGTARSARARKAEVELELANSGGMWRPPTRQTFDEYAEEWLGGYARHAVRPRVLENYRRELRRASAAFGPKQLGAVTRSDVKALLAARVAEGAAANTVRNTLIPLRELLAHAVDDGLIPSNPAARVPVPTRRERKITPPTSTQVESVIAAAREDAQDALVVAASLGLRRGELFALHWEDVDFEARLVRVHATNDRSKIVEATKTKAGERAVPLFESARRALAARRLRLPARLKEDDVTVFATAVGTPLDPGNFERREFKRALKAAGLEGAFRFHDLRHFAVSTLIAQRADIKLLQAIAGHASATVTLDVYGHLMADRVTEAAHLYDPLSARGRRGVDGGISGAATEATGEGGRPLG
jgi:integrase